mmetsp:Transcript_112743/g.313705  ORF Transcript_112743/g.313705 Transcript_112743/m.313705 type:complete len:232 (+) Transcript_112743:250-945(+)
MQLPRGSRRRMRRAASELRSRRACSMRAVRWRAPPWRAAGLLLKWCRRPLASGPRGLQAAASMRWPRSSHRRTREAVGELRSLREVMSDLGSSLPPDRTLTASRPHASRHQLAPRRRPCQRPARGGRQVRPPCAAAVTASRGSAPSGVRLAAASGGRESPSCHGGPQRVLPCRRRRESSRSASGTACASSVAWRPLLPKACRGPSRWRRCSSAIRRWAPRYSATRTCPATA